jgi:hypothetical protein
VSRAVADISTVSRLTRIDVHQHLWTEPLVAALRAREQPPFLRGETLTLAGEPPSRVVCDDIAARAQLVHDDGLDLALVVPSLALGPEPLDAYHEGCRDLPPEFRAWCSTSDPEALERLIEEGFVGLCLAAPDVERSEPLLHRLVSLGAPLLVHPGAATGTAHPALTDYVTQMHTAWFTVPRIDGLTIVWAMCAGLAPLHHERATARAVPALAGTSFYDTSSYGPKALAAMEEAGCRLVYGSDRPVVEPSVRGYFNSAEVFLSS